MPKSNTQPQLGQRLRDLRKRSGLTQNELARATRIAASSIYRLETGGNVSMATYIRITSYFMSRDPTVMMIAERILLLSEPERAQLLAMLERSEGARGR